MLNNTYDDLSSLINNIPSPTLTINSVLDTIPEGSQSFWWSNAIQIPAVGTGFTIILQFTVPDGYNGVIREISINYTGGGFIQASGDLVFEIAADGRALKNYEAMLTERGDSNHPQKISDLWIYSGQVITFQINHVQNPLEANAFVIAGASGYYFPSLS